ncbi:MAG: hypothetical protein K5656_06090 [Lachnospiraceae bacterium]|nr:hypothetical protein [Lachnospiraceae bacterium]
MGEYTSIIESKTSNVDLSADDFKSSLVDIVKAFRSADDAIDEFIIAHAYKGDINDTKMKTAFIKSKLKDAGISSRYLWYSGKTFDKTPAFELCFAFSINIAESEELFQKICLKRGFDCHSIKEAIYYYCIKNQLSYDKARELIELAPDEPANGSVNFEADVLFTQSIIEELNRIDSDEGLIDFFNRNIDQFGYNNATAKKIIKRIWDEIASDDGIIAKEIAITMPEYKDEIKLNNTYNILIAILGINKDNSLLKDSDRSIKVILKDNPLLHKSAEKEFPDRLSIEKILDGKMVDDEKIRKVMILLLFYRYWAKRIIESGKGQFFADYTDAERCTDDINKFLDEAGYPALYMGNPYDWIFMFVTYDESPLDAFRYFINELAIYKEDYFNNL